MDTRLKERLTGAIVLVAIVVLVVPALLSGPRQPTQPPEPSEGVTREMVIELDKDAPARPEDPAEPQPEPEPAAAVATLAGPAVEVAPSGVPAAPGGVPPGVTAPAPDAGATRPAASAPAPAPATAAPAKSAPAAAAPGPATTPAAAWAVQLGAFAARETAQRLVDDLKSRGYAAFWLEYRGGGKVLYRVRVGPEQDRARAEAVAARLKGEGYDRATVAPHP